MNSEWVSELVSSPTAVTHRSAGLAREKHACFGFVHVEVFEVGFMHLLGQTPRVWLQRLVLLFPADILLCFQPLLL